MMARNGHGGSSSRGILRPATTMKNVNVDIFVFNSGKQARSSIIHSYTIVFKAFAAKLSHKEAEALAVLCLLVVLIRKLDFYYETLCPACSSFMVNIFPKILDNGLIDIVHLHLVPFGNAKVGADSRTITCQHGPDECFLNMVEACVMNEWPHVRKHYPFLHCVESFVLEGRYQQWASCFQKTGLDPKPIADCVRNGTGEELMLKWAKKTNSLVPPHKYVPWVVVDGKHIEAKDIDDWMNIICKAYRGKHVPDYCKHPHEISLNGRESSKKHVCLVEEATT